MPDTWKVCTGALDDLWHALLLVSAVLCCAAVYGTWRFGTSREEWGSFGVSLYTEVVLLFTADLSAYAGVEGGDGLTLQLFVVLFVLVVNLLIMNFVLAIIVEAYMSVRQVPDRPVGRAVTGGGEATAFRVSWNLKRKLE